MRFFKAPNSGFYALRVIFSEHFTLPEAAFHCHLNTVVQKEKGEIISPKKFMTENYHGLMGWLRFAKVYSCDCHISSLSERVPPHTH